MICVVNEIFCLKSDEELCIYCYPFISKFNITKRNIITTGFGIHCYKPNNTKSRVNVLYRGALK